MQNEKLSFYLYGCGRNGFLGPADSLKKFDIENRKKRGQIINEC
jgi:hypothetical protein